MVQAILAKYMVYKEGKIVRKVFYSFHYDNDVMRVQQIRNMGVLEGNEPVIPNKWEEIKRSGRKAIENWIDINMKNASCVIVLIGENTYSRQWVRYEIEKALKDKKPMLGIYIHNLRDPNKGICRQGINPFDEIYYKGKKLSDFIDCYNPDSNDAYNCIKNNLTTWVEKAIQRNVIFYYI